MKYVMLTIKHCGMERKVPVVFPDFVCHDDMALWFGEAVKAGLTGAKILDVASAGFVDMFVHSTNGKSVTLGIDSDKDDHRVINLYDYFGGI